KVVRLDALPVIACMTHQPVGHLSISQEPRDAMSAVVLAETTESAIPVMSKRTCPFPAIAGRINLLPEQGYSVIIGVHRMLLTSGAMPRAASNSAEASCVMDSIP